MHSKKVFQYVIFILTIVNNKITLMLTNNRINGGDVLMKYDAMNHNEFEEMEFFEVETFERIKRRKPAKDPELRERGRKLNHRTKKKKDES